MKGDSETVSATLNAILELELAGTVRYTHYSLMAYGYNRIPIVKWLREQADEALVHAQQAGELITQLGHDRRIRPRKNLPGRAASRRSRQDAA